MGIKRYGERFEKRLDPRGRSYFWATNDPAPEIVDEENDLTALRHGDVTLTPLHYDLTKHRALPEMHNWNLRLTD